VLIWKQIELHTW